MAYEISEGAAAAALYNCSSAMLLQQRSIVTAAQYSCSSAIQLQQAAVIGLRLYGAAAIWGCGYRAAVVGLRL